MPVIGSSPLPATRFRALALLLQKSESGFESSIAGTSMDPAIPHGARIRIRPLESGDYKEGQIVVCVIGDSLFAHRIVYCGHGARTGAFILTQGDGWTLCDPPTPKSKILGLVTEYSEGGIWHATPDRAACASWQRIISYASLRLVRLALFIHYEFARRVAGGCLTVGAACKRMAAASSKARLGV